MALVGSGEFLPVMAGVDAALLRGRPPRAVVIPTAAALEGDARVAYWLELGRDHYRAMGVEAVGLDVRTRAQAEDPAVAGAVAGAGLVYLSGGDPHHLAATLGGTALGAAVAAAWRHGAALAGCSAGAMALTAGAPGDLLGPGPDGPGPDGPAPDGLGLVPGLAVIPHFDQMERWRPGVEARFAAWQPPGTALVGIEEDTALVGSGPSWQVQGQGKVWFLGREGHTGFDPGDEVPLPLPWPT
ncbi:MAG TPA: Type 1 glutamine amidotransferase-like domain-containing protein [Acidimicrobiales bacterium]|nr:Type 1 glutamine amidotransferase-like domain-containing protein [Acidimicrobiales bacterium]